MAEIVPFSPDGWPPSAPGRASEHKGRDVFLLAPCLVLSSPPYGRVDVGGRFLEELARGEAATCGVGKLFDG
eukprot:15616692-Heterocapsa_arctica.AAC.1